MNKNEFANWMGRENGKEIIYAIAMDNETTKEQIRAAVVTYCLLYSIEVNTPDYDDLMEWFYFDFNSWFGSINEAKEYFAELL